MLTDARQVSGGTVANTVVGVASLGGRPAFLGTVADDLLGTRYGEDLVSAGVAAMLSTVPGTAEAGTGACYVMVTPDAERTMATHLGVSSGVDHPLINVELLASVAICYFDGYLLDFPDAALLVDAVLDAASASHTALALGLADPFVVERHHNSLVELISTVDVLFCNEDEILALSGSKTVAEAIATIRRDDLVVVVTRGAKGAVVASGDEVIEVAAELVDEVVDVTGAGDLFAAGVLFGLTRGLDLRDCARLGALTASEIIGHLGARPAVSLAEMVKERGLLAH
jgi:sugar/nucleoside kinase (ribokinase family)